MTRQARERCLQMQLPKHHHGLRGDGGRNPNYPPSSKRKAGHYSAVQGTDIKWKKDPKEAPFSMQGRSRADKTGRESRSKGRKARSVPAASLYASVCSAGEWERV